MSKRFYEQLQTLYKLKIRQHGTSRWATKWYGLLCCWRRRASSRCLQGTWTPSTAACTSYSQCSRRCLEKAIRRRTAWPVSTRFHSRSGSRLADKCEEDWPTKTSGLISVRRYFQQAERARSWYHVCQSYLVDAIPLYAASVLAATVLFRSLGEFGFPFFAQRMYLTLAMRYLRCCRRDWYACAVCSWPIWTVSAKHEQIRSE